MSRSGISSPDELLYNFYTQHDIYGEAEGTNFKVGA